VAVQVDGHFEGCLEGLDQLVGIVGGDQAGHVLDADAVGAHGFELLGLVDKIVQVVDLAPQTGFGQGVADAALEMHAVFLDLRNDGLEVAVVVQGVEGAEDVHAVFTGAVHEGIGHIVGVVAVAHQVLGPQEHGKGGFLEIALQGPDALPGIFVQEAVHGVEGGSAPGFHRPEADFVHGFSNGNHVFSPPAGGEQRLVAVAQGQVHHLDGVGRRRSIRGVIHVGHVEYGVLAH
jgi:hypothetical protein